MSGQLSEPEAISQTITYLGIQRVLEFGEVGMEDNELWWEFQDERPRVSERPPQERSARRLKEKRR